MSVTILRVRNVCEALGTGIAHLEAEGREEETRGGPCIVAPGPVLTETLRPTERVLFSAVRDANPFFHLWEAIWMLAGRDDVSSLSRYVRNFGERFGEPGGELHGAYGHRWRRSLGFDQLDAVVARLSESRGDRQCVIQMWDSSLPERCRAGECDPEKLAGSDDLRGAWRDRPCNTHVYLRIRQEVETLGGTMGDSTPYQEAADVLDLTVCCRSNDAVWGAHGANAVHFSVLQEYLAARIGVGVGIMVQLSNNYHVYVAELERLRSRVEVDGVAESVWCYLVDDRYAGRAASLALPMFDAPGAIDADVGKFCAWHDGSMGLDGVAPVYANSWFGEVAEPALLAHWFWRREKHREAQSVAEKIRANDWRLACAEWLRRRIK